MAANHGVIGPFDSSQEDWLSYIAPRIAHLQNYFVAITISQRTRQPQSVRQSCSVFAAYQPTG